MYQIKVWECFCGGDIRYNPIILSYVTVKGSEIVTWKVTVQKDNDRKKEKRMSSNSQVVNFEK